jgi:uncharacterized iron-regulated protein
MLSLAALTFALAVQAPVDPNQLPIGLAGSVTVAPGTLVDLRTGKTVSLPTFAEAAAHDRFVFLGENHATTAHQQMEADVIKALVSAGRSVEVGVEMYTRPKQDDLDAWSAGSMDEATFLTQSDWNGQWGKDFAYYRPVFQVVKDKHLPLIALNVPRAWVHTVATKGFESLPTSARLQLPPELFLGNKEHRQVFDSLMGGHAMSGSGMDGMYAAQVLWDEAMADTALKYVATQPSDPKAVFVVIAGSGHVMYGQGINYRIARRHGGKGLTMVMLQSNDPVQVARGLGDFAYVTRPEGGG